MPGIIPEPFGECPRCDDDSLLNRYGQPFAESMPDLASIRHFGRRYPTRRGACHVTDVDCEPHYQKIQSQQTGIGVYPSVVSLRELHGDWQILTTTDERSASTAPFHVFLSK